MSAQENITVSFYCNRCSIQATVKKKNPKARIHTKLLMAPTIWQKPILWNAIYIQHIWGCDTDSHLNSQTSIRFYSLTGKSQCSCSSRLLLPSNVFIQSTTVDPVGLQLIEEPVSVTRCSVWQENPAQLSPRCLSRSIPLEKRGMNYWMFISWTHLQSKRMIMELLDVETSC